MFSEKQFSGLRKDTNYDEEIAFYQNGFENKNIDFIPNDFLKMGSYKTAFKSEIIIGMFSTLLIEMLGAGKKILFGGFLDDSFNKESKEKAYKYLPSNVLLYNVEVNHIQNKIETLINMSKEEYLEMTAFARDYYMRCERPYPHEMIKKRIAEHLNISAE